MSRILSLRLIHAMHALTSRNPMVLADSESSRHGASNDVFASKWLS